MMTPVTFAALFALVVQSHAACVAVFSDLNCANAAPVSSPAFCVANGGCTTENQAAGGSATITCSGTGSAATFQYAEYSDSTDCSSSSSASATGSASALDAAAGAAGCAAVGPANAAFVRVDCSAGGGCFSATAHVTLESGEAIPYADVKVGDRVLSISSDGIPTYDKVFRITHHDPEEHREYVRITTTTGRQLELTTTHYMHVNSMDMSELTLASEVAKGDTVYVVTPGASAARPETVASVARVWAKGAFNAHTLSGNIVVSGMAASHFTTESTWGAGSRHLASMWYSVVDMMSAVVGPEDADRPRSYV